MCPQVRWLESVEITDHKSCVLKQRTIFPTIALHFSHSSARSKSRAYQFLKGSKRDHVTLPCFFLSLLLFFFFFFLFFSFPVVGRVKDTFKINTRETKAGELAGLNDV